MWRAPGEARKETSAAIAAAWERELPGVPVSSIGVITPLWRAAKTLADDRRRALYRIGIDPATLDLLTHEEELVGGLTAEERQTLAGLLARLDPAAGRQPGSVV